MATMSLMAIGNHSCFVARNSYIDYCDFTTHTILQVTDTLCDEIITDLSLSFDDKLLAVLFSKKVLIYEIPHLKNIQSFTLPRSASKIRFSVNNTQIFVADKTGDVLLFKLNEDTGTKLLGHLSLLLNVLQSSDGKYIISSDRDEKIKVSCYPNTYNIQTYCLGHKEFVNHIEILPIISDYLISASGDGTVKCWNYKTGKLLYTIDTSLNIHNNDILIQEFTKLMGEEDLEVKNLPVVDFTITELNKSSCLIALVVHSYMKILVYELHFADKKFNHHLIQQITVKNFPTAIKFRNLSLFIYDNVNSEVLEYQVENKDDKVIMNLHKTEIVFKNNEIKLSVNDSISIKQLFKRKFDNVQEYQERKKNRIEKSTS